MLEPTVFGRQLREARLTAGLSLRDLSDKLGITHVFLGEVERGVKSKLAEKHWDALLKALPELKRSMLEEWAKRSSTLEFKLQDLSCQDQDITLALARSIQSQNLSDQDKRKILDLLEGPLEDRRP